MPTTKEILEQELLRDAPARLQELQSQLGTIQLPPLSNPVTRKERDVIAKANISTQLSQITSIQAQIEQVRVFLSESLHYLALGTDANIGRITDVHAKAIISSIRNVQLFTLNASHTQLNSPRDIEGAQGFLQTAASSFKKGAEQHGSDQSVFVQIGQPLIAFSKEFQKVLQDLNTSKKRVDELSARATKIQNFQQELSAKAASKPSSAASSTKKKPSSSKKKAPPPEVAKLPDPEPTKAAEPPAVKPTSKSWADMEDEYEEEEKAKAELEELKSRLEIRGRAQSDPNIRESERPNPDPSFSQSPERRRRTLSPPLPHIID